MFEPDLTNIDCGITTSEHQTVSYGSVDSGADSPLSTRRLPLGHSTPPVRQAAEVSIESAFAGAVGRMNSRILEIGGFMPNHTVINFCAGFGMENTLIASRIRPYGRLLAVDSNTDWLRKLDAALKRRSLRSIVDIRPHDVTLPLSTDFTASHLLCLLALHYLDGSSAVTDMWRRYATSESLFITADWLPGQLLSTDWVGEIENKLPAVGNLWQLEETEVIAEGWHEVGVGALRYVGIVIRCWSPAGEPIAAEEGQ